MIAYLDSSVLIRIIFREPDRIEKIDKFNSFISSRIIGVECFRTLHRLYQERKITEAELVKKSGELRNAISEITLIDVSTSVLNRSMESFPIHLKSLDAIHLSSSILWRETRGEDITFLTHDDKLGKAAAILNFKIMG